VSAIGPGMSVNDSEVSAGPRFAGRPPRILIVDDERYNRQLLEVMLAPEGFQLLAAASGAEALAIVDRDPPDVILLDVMMPETDGYAIADKIKGNLATKHIPIIMITALDNREARIQALSVGAEDFLTKPVDRAELCMRVRNLSRLKAYGDYYENQAAVFSEQAALLDLAQDAIVALDLHGRILYWNRGAETMYGWPGSDALGKDTADLLRAEFTEPADGIEATLLRDGRWEGEVIHHRRDGSRLVVASRYALQRDGNGMPARLLTISSDITGRKAADAERLLQAERLSLATSIAKVGVWIYDLSSREFTWDATMFGIYGIPTSASVPYETWCAAIHPADLPAAQASLQKVVEEGDESGEFRILRRDGSERHVSAIEGVVLDSSGNVIRIIGVNIDVTDRKRLEEAVKSSEETFSAAMEHASIGMAIAEPGGRWLKVNEAMCEMLGFTDRELLQTDSQSITHTDDLEADLELVRQLLSGSIHTYQTEKRYVHKDGHIIWVLLNVSLVRNADGSPRYFVKQCQNITARRQVDRMKREFIATVSHELRTPLTSIRGSLGLIRGGATGALPEKAARLIEVAYQNSNRLALIVDDILNMEQIDCGRMSLELSSQLLAPLLEQAVEENLGYALGCHVHLVITRPLPAVKAGVDANRLLQVLANLLSNAAKFSPAEASVEIAMVVVGARVRISVTDHGPGIPHSFRDRIFQRFSQADGSDSRHKSGTGLGLTIAKALIERMGGTISYNTKPGIATTFIIELPAASDG
jgi:PAS domain S-box-containing protein